MPRLLIVEDNAELANGLIHLLGAKHQVTHACNLETAKQMVVTSDNDLFILDVTLPDGSGFDLYDFLLKEKGGKPSVIFLTGEGDLTNRMKALELGAQDYILKPFYSKELCQRVEMRLQQIEEQSPFMMVGDLKFEKNLHRVFHIGVNKQELSLNLTPNEYKILSLLVNHRSEDISRSKIVDLVWGVGFNLSDKAVNSHISNLRKKIQNTSCKIVATENEGYKLSFGSLTQLD